MIDNKNSTAHRSAERSSAYVKFRTAFATMVNSTLPVEVSCATLVPYFADLTEDEQTVVRNSILTVMPSPMVLMPFMTDTGTAESTWAQWTDFNNTQFPNAPETSERHRTAWFRSFYLLAACGLVEQQADGQYAITPEGMIYGLRVIAKQYSQ
jgi:hypothetical protein